MATLANGKAEMEPLQLADVIENRGESLARAVDLLATLEQDGTLEALVQFLPLLKLLRDAMTDDMVVGLAQRVEEASRLLTDPVPATWLDRLPSALQKAHQAQERHKDRPRLGELFRMLRDPDVLRVLQFGLQTAKHLGKEYR